MASMAIRNRESSSKRRPEGFPNPSAAGETSWSAKLPRQTLQQQFQQPAVWSWLNNLGADDGQMVTPSCPRTPPAQISVDHFSLDNGSGSHKRLKIRRGLIIPGDEDMTSPRDALAADARSFTSTGGVLFGLSGLFSWRPDDSKVTNTPQWRPGPAGHGTLCNVCGLLFAKRRKHKDSDVWSMNVNNARGGGG
ncbi:hypothetical protein PspLS_08169 [Pyricularia sp. CBS 133598]|nr:hypothetical protein PspLS_08169 [Pyricularia sp. CBS 133598]